MHIASKYERLSEPTFSWRVSAGVFTNQAYALNRNRNESYYNGAYRLYRGNPRVIYFNYKVLFCQNT